MDNWESNGASKKTERLIHSPTSFELEYRKDLKSCKTGAGKPTLAFTVGAGKFGGMGNYIIVLCKRAFKLPTKGGQNAGAAGKASIIQGIKKMLPWKKKEAGEEMDIRARSLDLVLLNQLILITSRRIDSGDNDILGLLNRPLTPPAPFSDLAKLQTPTEQSLTMFGVGASYLPRQVNEQGGFRENP